MTNRIHQLDTREQKSPQYLEDIPNLIHEELEAGDYLTVEMKFVSEIAEMMGENGLKERHGHLVENKFKDFDIQSTDTVDQFHKELFQMDQWRLKNPHVVLHAAWVKQGIWQHPYVFKENGTRVNIIKTFMSMCAEYDVWPHFYETGEDLLKFYKKLDQPSAYKKYGIFIPRDHTPITLRAKKFRQHPRVSSELAVALDANLTSCGFPSPMSMFHGSGNIEVEIYDEVLEIIIHTIGTKKNGKPKKLAVDLIDYIENGPKQKKQDPPVVFDGVF